MPVKTKMRIIHANILIRRFTSVIAAIADDMEKKTSGTTVVKSRLRKISPKGLNKVAFCLKTTPRREPMTIEKINNSEKA